MTIRLKGTDIKLCFSFFVCFSLMLLLSDGKTALICFFSSALHEGGHLLFMFLFSQKVSAVTLSAFGVRIDREGENLLSYGKEALIALGGVLVNFFLCAIAAALFFFFKSYEAAVLFFVNIFLALLNLMPADKLDMWNVLFCLLMKKNDVEKTVRILSVLSGATLVLFCTFSALYFVFIGFNVSLLAVCIYLIYLKLSSIRNGE